MNMTQDDLVKHSAKIYFVLEKCSVDKNQDLFDLFQLALCGHMELKQQIEFLKDAERRGLL